MKYYSMTHGFIIKNIANNLYVFFLLTTYKSYRDTQTGTEEKYKTKIKKTKTMTPMCRAKQTPMNMATR